MKTVEERDEAAMKDAVSSSGRTFWRNTGKSLLLILLCAVLGTGLLLLSEFLPAGPMDKNLERSADIF